MQYMLLFNETAEEVAKRDRPRGRPGLLGRLDRLYGRAGAKRRDAQRKRPADARRQHDDPRREWQRHVVDGPFADTKEILGGYVIIDVADLDAALEWAARAPCVTAGSVEIRPVLAPPAG